ncbi:MAG TPA: integrase arm-type DNA-binding domain-containing protein [Gammaproteobacteria bacterium]
MPLTKKKIEDAEPRETPRKLADAGGLYLEITPAGGRYWRWKYRYAGKEKRLALGVYPEVTLSEARERREEARRLLRDGIDPGEHKKALKRAQRVAATNSFEAVAREWITKQSTPSGPAKRTAWSASTIEQNTERLENNVFPWLGRRPIAEIEPPELLEVLRRVEERGAAETAHRIRSLCSRVFRYAIATGRAKRDMAADLRGALAPASNGHFATTTDPKRIADLIAAVNEYQGSFIVKCALSLAPLVFVRPGELRAAEWSEFALEGATWRIPAARMKMGRDHLVPLSTQALEILHELHPLTGRGRYLFPSLRSPQRPMSDNTLNAALRRLGYAKDEITAHGFRHMASTLLNEAGWNPDAIERQLAHVEKNRVRGVYNAAEYLSERRAMMEAWGDYLRGLELGLDVSLAPPG